MSDLRDTAQNYSPDDVVSRRFTCICNHHIRISFFPSKIVEVSSTFEEDSVSEREPVENFMTQPNRPVN